mgnify:CR=1 FL=1
MARTGGGGLTLFTHAETTRVSCPCREDECERVLKAGARVLTLDQLEGIKVQHSFWEAAGPFQSLQCGAVHACLRVVWQGSAMRGLAAAVVGMPDQYGRYTGGDVHSSHALLLLLSLNGLLADAVPVLCQVCRTPRCGAGPMRPTAMGTLPGCGPPAGSTPGRPSPAASGTQASHSNPPARVGRWEPSYMWGDVTSWL